MAEGEERWTLHPTRVFDGPYADEVEVVRASRFEEVQQKYYAELDASMLRNHALVKAEADLERAQEALRELWRNPVSQAAVKRAGEVLEALAEARERGET